MLSAVLTEFNFSFLYANNWIFFFFFTSQWSTKYQLELANVSHKQAITVFCDSHGEGYDIRCSDSLGGWGINVHLDKSMFWPSNGSGQGCTWVWFCHTPHHPVQLVHQFSSLTERNHITNYQTNQKWVPNVPVDSWIQRVQYYIVILLLLLFSLFQKSFRWRFWLVTAYLTYQNVFIADLKHFYFVFIWIMNNRIYFLLC